MFTTGSGIFLLLLIFILKLFIDCHSICKIYCIVKKEVCEILIDKRVGVVYKRLMKHVLPSFRRFIAENVAVCSKCCDKDVDEESLTAGSRTQDYAALQ